MKKTILTAAIVIVSNTLSAVEIADGLKQKLLTQGLSDNCNDCVLNQLEGAQITQPNLFCFDFQQNKASPYLSLSPDTREACASAIQNYMSDVNRVQLSIIVSCETACKP